MSSVAWHQFISKRDHPNQSFYLEGHSSSAETVIVDGDDDDNDDIDAKNNDDNYSYDEDNDNITLRNACRVLRIR